MGEVNHFKSLFTLGEPLVSAHEDKARVIVMNTISVAVIALLFVLATFFIATASYRALWSLMLLPLFITILWLNKSGRLNVSRLLFTYGLLVILFVLAVGHRRTGAEYTLIAVACSSAFSFSRLRWITTSFFVSMLGYVIYRGIDYYLPFVPDDTVNYPLASVINAVICAAGVFFEMAVFRMLINRYAASYRASNEKLNLINAELNLVNESLDYMVQVRTHELEDKTAALQAQKEKLNVLVEQLDANNTKLNNTVVALKQRNFEMDQVIYRISHNLKGPVCSIAGLNNLMKMDLNKELVQVALPMIDQKIQEMENVFQSLACLADLHQERVTPTALKLGHIVTRVQEAIQDVSGADQVSIRVEGGMQSLHSDQQLLYLVFYHIIRNAIVFRSTMRSSYLEVTFEERAPGYRIFFKDNGIGISDKIKDRIFDMFFQGTDVASGAGLGLYITRQIVHRLGGDIHVTSSDEGTVVELYVPSLQVEKPLIPMPLEPQGPTFPLTLLRGA